MEDEMDMNSDAHDHTIDADFVIEDNNAFLMAMGQGSRIEIHAADAEKESWTQLETTAEAGSNELVLQEETDWEVGDKIAIASTSNDWEEAEEFTILSVSDDGKTFTLDGELQHTHIGETLEYDNGQTGEDHREWEVEMRAEVALLTRNVTIQGDDDSVDDGFGGHTMVMDGAEQHISGAEFYRMGQEDVLGRYPVHWHMLADAEGQYVENISVHESYQKGSTIHGTSNIRYEGNVIYDHVGHGVFFEDGSENDNQIYGNLVFSTQESETGEPIPTDGEHVSSFWIENPNNAFIGNHAAGSESNGFWIFEGQLHGLSAEIDVGDAGQLHDLVFIGNTGHSTSGDGGAGGTDKILGIDGRITDDLDFRQSTLAAEFGTIEGFTAYAGPVWSLTHEMVFSDSAFVDVRFFSRHENVIKDSVFDDTTNVLYRDGGNQYIDVMFTGGARILPLSSDHANTPHVFDNVVDEGSQVIASGNTVNQQSVVDIDGSYTGVAGGFLTPGGVNGVFNAAPGAVSFDNGFLSAYTIGATEITALGIDGAVRVVRADDGASIDSLELSDDSRNRGDDNEDRSDANYEFYTTAGMPQDMAYLIDFEDAPEDLILNLANVRDGESVIYEVQNIDAIGGVDGGVEVDSLEDLVQSDVTAYMHDGDSLFIRIVADRVEVQDERPVEDALADYRAFGKIEFAGLVEGDDDSAGSREISDDLIAAIEDMPIREAADAPESAPAAVDINESYIGYDLKMTEAEAGVEDTSAKASFEVNYDVASRTVSISGEYSDLTSDITMVHLHGIDDSVLGGLSHTGGEDGTFSGSVVLTAAEAEDFLAGDTYVNLHTEDHGGGELRGQVDVYAAGDFVLDRYESTSDTTVVTDDMARWSEASTWGDAGVPGADDVVVIGHGQTVILDETTLVKGIIVNGGELIVEDDADLDIELSTDYLLVIEGGLFQAGTEDDPLDTNFTLTLEGDDPDFDLEVGQYLLGNLPNTVFADVTDDMDHGDHEMPDDDDETDDHEMPDDGETDDETDDDTPDEEDEPDDHSDHEMPDDGEADDETDDDTSDDDVDERDDDTASPADDDADTVPEPSDADIFTLNIVNTDTDEVMGNISNGAELSDDVIGNDAYAIAIDPDMEVGSLVLRIDDFVQVINPVIGEDGSEFAFEMPEGALFEEGETVDIEVAAYSGPDATGDHLGDVAYSIAVPEEESDDGGNFLTDLLDIILSLFGGGGDDSNRPTAEFTETETLLSDILPTIEFDEGVAVVEEDEPDLVLV